MTQPPTASKPADKDEVHLLNALRDIAQGDCWGRDDDETCNCPPCIATNAMRQADEWRFEAAMSERIHDGFHPAEARMIAAFKRYLAASSSQPDVRLAQILRLDGPWDVTRRDWYVAVSVVQWLATNIGSTVVEQAGYKYTKYDEDRRCRDEKLPPTLGKVVGDPVVAIRACATNALADPSKDRLHDAMEQILELAGGTKGDV